ncbi:MAG TPA: hypothetical protein VF949_03100 [Reyranella sp.]|jgi:hypothetical protein
MDTLRFTIGFLIAPLAIPVIEFRVWERPALPAALLWLVFLSVIVAYAGTFLFGIAAVCFLRARKWTAFWFAPAAGFIVAGLIWSLMEVALIALFGTHYFEFHGYLDWLHTILWPYGPLGAVIASLLWVMAWLERAGNKEKADEG